MKLKALNNKGTPGSKLWQTWCLGLRDNFIKVIHTLAVDQSGKKSGGEDASGSPT